MTEMDFLRVCHFDIADKYAPVFLKHKPATALRIE
jgi:hypothetical protein